MDFGACLAAFAGRWFGKRARHIWRYELEPDESGRRTQVTETFDYDPSPAAAVYERIGIPGRNRKAIEATLQRLKVLVEGRAHIAT